VTETKWALNVLIGDALAMPPGVYRPPASAMASRKLSPRGEISSMSPRSGRISKRPARSASPGGATFYTPRINVAPRRRGRMYCVLGEAASVRAKARSRRNRKSKPQISRRAAASAGGALNLIFALEIKRPSSAARAVSKSER